MLHNMFYSLFLIFCKPMSRYLNFLRIFMNYNEYFINNVAAATMRQTYIIVVFSYLYGVKIFDETCRSLRIQIRITRGDINIYRRKSDNLFRKNNFG